MAAKPAMCPSAAASSQGGTSNENESLQAVPPADTSPDDALPGSLAGLTLLASVVCSKHDALRPTANRLLRSLGMPERALSHPE